MHGSPALGNTPRSIKELIDLLGGPSEVGRICGVTRNQPWRWAAASKKNCGTGGKVPRKYWKVLMDHAAQKGVTVPAELLAPELAE